MVAALVVACAVLTGCSSSQAPSDPPRPEVPPPPPGTVDGRFPVTVTHGFGETVVPAAPERVVVDAYGNADLDALLALGVRPIATTQVPVPVPSWTRARLGESPLDQVVHLPDVPGFVHAGTRTPLGGVDLITDASTSITPERYADASAIAPTITPPAGTDGLSTWQDTTRLIGQAVGKPVEAERLVTDVEARIAAAPARYPQLAGRTGACVSIDTGKCSTYRFAVDGPRGGCGRLLAWLGMRGVPALDTPPGGELYRFTPADIAAARPDVVVLTNEDGVRETEREILPPGLRVVDLDQDEQGTSLVYDSVLSIPIVLDTFPPKLVRALG